MKKYRGVIIEESLRDVSVLQEVHVLSSKVERVTAKHQTPWLKKWTLHTIEVEREEVEITARKISANINPAHSHAWYADFDNGKLHYIVFPKKIFRVDMQSEPQYAAAKAYAISLGIPPYQADFHPREEKWQRL